MISKMTLVERADLQRPVVPASSISHPIVRSEDITIQMSPRRKNINIPDFIQEEREVYHMQLHISKKVRQIEKLSATILQSEQDLQNREEEIIQTSANQKAKTNSDEAELSKIRKSVENAIAKRVDLQKDLKRHRQIVSNISSEISRNETSIELYRLCKKLLVQYTPDSKNFSEVFTSPSVLLGIFEDIEAENLNLTKTCSNITDEIMETSRRQSEEQKEIDKDISDVKMEFQSIKYDPICKISEGNIKDSAGYEEEMTRISRDIYKVYSKCFGKPESANPISLLEEIELGIERLYKMIEMVDAKFVAAKSAIREKNRREQKRRETQKRNEENLREKNAKAMMRAAKPVKRREGRPIVSRVLPRTRSGIDDEEEKEQLAKQQRLNQNLYGPLFE